MAADAKPTPPTRFQLKQKRKQSRERFLRVRKAEKKMARQLKSVASQVGSIVRTFAPGGVVHSQPELDAALRRYATLLDPWAKRVSAAFVFEIAQRDEHAWEQAAREMGRSIREQIQSAPVGPAMVAMAREQAELIKSLPIEASQRVHRLTVEALSGGTRAKEIAKEIQKTGSVTASRAALIARTETGRTATTMTSARAKHIGSLGYIWRTADDADVRPLHRKLEGTYHAWNDPPVAGENGERAHAGAIYNCRCFPEPVLPDEV